MTNPDQSSVRNERKGSRQTAILVFAILILGSFAVLTASFAWFS